MTMKNLHFKAAILEKSKSPLIVDEVSVNTELLPGQILVKLKYSGICGKQVEEVDAHFGLDRFLPHLLGHEGSGIVVAVGESVSKVTEGDRVILHWMNGSGIPAASGEYHWAGKKLNAGQLTTFNEFAVVPEIKLTKIPKNSNLVHAAMLGCGLSTGFGAVFNESKPSSQSKVVVWGCGGVGLSVVIACRVLGISEILVVDRSDLALARASNCGAKDFFDLKRSEEGELFKKFGGSFDFGYVCTGDPLAISLCHRLMRDNSSLFVVGVPPPNQSIAIDPLMLHKRKMITGSYGGSIIPERDLQNYLEIISSKSFPMKYFKGETINLDEINAGIDLTRQGGHGRIIIEF